MTDAELLKAIDEHDEDLDSYGTTMLESMMRRVEGGNSLTEKQRAWAERMLQQLDTRLEG